MLPKPEALPEDAAFTTTSLGQRVPYIVRIETGTINRAIYQIAVLHNPVSESAPGPLTPPSAWNRRILYSFGGGCIGGWYGQERKPRRGRECGRHGHRVGRHRRQGICLHLVNPERVRKQLPGHHGCRNHDDGEGALHRVLRCAHFTFGRGGSGGAYQQVQIADNYPGLLDGIIPGATFPDVLATIQFLTDIQLLDRYYRTTGASLTEEQKRQVAGVGNFRTIAQTAPGADRIKAPGMCPPDLPPSARYDPRDQPRGIRCNVFDHTVNAYGRDPVTRFARRPVDNVGVQYGLTALNDGMISPAQFLDLNERIGGYDNDGNYIASRTSADPLGFAQPMTPGVSRTVAEDWPMFPSSMPEAISTCDPRATFT